MKVRELATEWEQNARGALCQSTHRVHLDLDAEARLAALCEMYPRRHPEELLGELVSAALHDLEESFPYVKGNRVVSTDEQGDPVYEDAGPTPRFLALARKHRERLLTSRAAHKQPKD